MSNIKQEIKEPQSKNKTIHIGHFTHTTESTDIEVQNMEINVTCNTNCKYRITATLYT
jgi:hypothetical protein